MTVNDSTNPHRRDQLPCLIVGGGPIGLETAVHLQRFGIESLVVDAGAVGHTISWWAPQTRWFSSNERIAIAGVPLHPVSGEKSTREEYLNYLRHVVRQFGLTIQTRTRIQSVSSDSDGRLEVVGVSANGEQTWMADNVVLAIGGTDHPNRLGVPGEDLPHVDGYLREIHRYFQRRVVVVGGRNSAIEAALRIFHGGGKVTLVYRGEGLPEDHIKYWLLPEIRGLVRSGRIDAHFDSQITRIDLDAVTVQTPDGEQRLQADDVLTLIGYHQDKRLFDAVGVELVGDMQRPKHDPETMQTNVDGVYVAGTAVAGTQSSSYKTFLENCHDHPKKIAADIARKRQHASPKQGSSAEASVPLAAQDRVGYERLIEMQPES